MANKLKKYKINFNAVCFDYKTGMLKRIWHVRKHSGINGDVKNALKDSEVIECYTNIKFKFIHIKIN